jgi:polysaccharide biosynthesis protein PslH
MRMLFVTYRFPAYSGDAPSNTVFNLVKYFSRKNEVSLVGLAPGPVSSEARERLAPYCRRFEFVPWPKWRGALHAVGGLPSPQPLQVSYYRSREFAAKVRQIIAEERIELAYGYHLRAGQFLAGIDSIPRVLAIQPAQILHFGRRCLLTHNPVLRLVYGMEYRRLLGYEADVAAKFDSCLLISPKDRDAIDPHHRLGNVFFNPHGADVQSFAPPPGNVRDPSTIVFSGAMHMDTNTDAALYFHREILPLIWARCPHARFIIVGKNPPYSVQKLAEDSRITVTGFVPDLRPYLWKAAVAVNPIRMAAGMQNKLIEGLAAGLPMVISPEANEGIHAPVGKAVVLAHNPQEFAASVLALLDNLAAAGELGAQGQAFVQANWSWEHHFEQLEDLLHRLVANRVSAIA